MKTKGFIFAAAVLAAGTLAAEVVLIGDGRPLARIYHAPLSQDGAWTGTKELGKQSIPELDAKALAMAITDLNYHFKVMSGAELEVVVTDDPKAVQGPAIVIGALANALGAQPDIAQDPSQEAFRVKVAKDRVLIGGAGDFGASHGIYALLERLGCAWVMPGSEGEVIPRLTTVKAPDMDVQEAPSFTYRRFPYDERPTEEQWHDLFVWLLRHKSNFPLGRRRHGFSAGGHVWGSIISRNKKEFDEHPEMRALVRNADGSLERRGWQLETTHPRVVELAIEYIRQTFKSNNWSNDAAVCIGMGPSDGGNVSLSAETMNLGANRVDYPSGQPDGTDVVVHFLNTLLEKTSAEFPNLRLGFLIYSWHADYPARYKPHPRIVVSIMDIMYSRFHSALDETSRSRAYYRDIVQQWGRLAHEQGNQVDAGSYNWNLADSVMPYSKAKYYGDEFRFRQEAGIAGLGWLVAPDDWYVTAHHSYVGIKLAWNAQLDWQTLLREFCEKAYGVKAAPFLEAYYRELVERQTRGSHEAGSFFAFPLLYDHAFVAEQEKRFDDALAASGQEAERKRIASARYPLRTLGHFLDMRDAYARFDFAATRDHFEKALGSIDEIGAQSVLFGNKRGKLYFGGYRKFVEQAEKYSSGEYRIEYCLPNRLKTAIDINNLGAFNRFWGSTIDDSAFLTTETYLSTWDAQGLAGLQQGSVWYRARFTLDRPPDKDQGVGLFIGGADNRLAVWCNDRFIARATAGHRSPTSFDLTEAIRPGGEENLLAIQVTRQDCWELFTGGLVLPSFVFSGPRVEQPKDAAPPFRMLPGGVLEPTR